MPDRIRGQRKVTFRWSEATAIEIDRLYKHLRKVGRWVPKTHLTELLVLQGLDHFEDPDAPKREPVYYDE